MQRRHFLLGSAAALLGSAAAGGVWLAGEPAPIHALADIAAARRWLEQLVASGDARTLAGWPLPQVLEHAAQSIDYSIDGYPLAYSALFQASAGRLAFAVFNRRGAMQHGLDEAIPGAPPLIDHDLPQAALRLDGALARFAAHRGALAAHFAYGALSHADYQRAHLMHLADHARRVTPAPA